MPKTKQELDQLKQEYNSLQTKLKELDEDELKIVTGGNDLKEEIDYGAFKWEPLYSDENK